MSITQIIVTIYLAFAGVALEVVQTLMFDDSFNYPATAAMLIIMLMGEMWLKEKMK
mgnify:CR=1 FL=1